MVDNEGT